MRSNVSHVLERNTAMELVHDVILVLENAAEDETHPPSSWDLEPRDIELNHQCSTRYFCANRLLISGIKPSITMAPKIFPLYFSLTYLHQTV